MSIEYFETMYKFSELDFMQIERKITGTRLSSRHVDTLIRLLKISLDKRLDRVKETHLLTEELRRCQ